MPNYWLGVACKEHVATGKKLGIAQVCHGKPGPLRRMAPGDWIIYYSPVERFGEKVRYRKFTALGQIKDTEPYQVCITEDFCPWRRNVEFENTKEVAIEPLIDTLSFIKNKTRWGFPFRRGCFELPEKDFITIATAMRTTDDQN